VLPDQGHVDGCQRQGCASRSRCPFTALGDIREVARGAVSRAPAPLQQSPWEACAFIPLSSVSWMHYFVVTSTAFLETGPERLERFAA
jgi:hypothetical protein